MAEDMFAQAKDAAGLRRRTGKLLKIAKRRTTDHHKLRRNPPGPALDHGDLPLVKPHTPSPPSPSSRAATPDATKGRLRQEQRLKAAVADVVSRFGTQLPANPAPCPSGADFGFNYTSQMAYNACRTLWLPKIAPARLRALMAGGRHAEPGAPHLGRSRAPGLRSLPRKGGRGLPPVAEYLELMRHLAEAGQAEGADPDAYCSGGLGNLHYEALECMPHCHQTRVLALTAAAGPDTTPPCMDATDVDEGSVHSDANTQHMDEEYVLLPGGTEVVLPAAGTIQHDEDHAPAAAQHEVTQLAALMCPGSVHAGTEYVASDYDPPPPPILDLSALLAMARVAKPLAAARSGLASASTGPASAMAASNASGTSALFVDGPASKTQAVPGQVPAAGTRGKSNRVKWRAVPYGTWGIHVPLRAAAHHGNAHAAHFGIVAGAPSFPPLHAHTASADAQATAAPAASCDAGVHMAKHTAPPELIEEAGAGAEGLLLPASLSIEVAVAEPFADDEPAAAAAAGSQAAAAVIPKVAKEEGEEEEEEGKGEEEFDGFVLV